MAEVSIEDDDLDFEALATEAPGRSDWSRTSSQSTLVLGSEGLDGQDDPWPIPGTQSWCLLHDYWETR